MNPNITINNTRINWLAVVLTAALIMLLFSWCNGVRVGKRQLAEIKNAKANNARLKEDSLKKEKELVTLKMDTAGTNELIRDLFLTQEFQEGALSEREIETRRLALLVQKLRNSPADTIELLNDCSDLAEAYFREKDVSRVLAKINDSIEIALNDRIDQGDKIAAHWNERYDTCMAAYNSLYSSFIKIKPRHKIKIGLTAAYSPFVYGLGGVFAYEDRKGKEFQGAVIPTNKGLLYQAMILIPISFRR